jgi:hypothetical protein
MAAGIMIALVEPHVCEVPCGHTDCAFHRAMVGIACSTCGEPIESGQRYYRNDVPLPHGESLSTKNMVGKFVHAVCLERTVERDPRLA